jgi:predicted aspartyl protease
MSRRALYLIAIALSLTSVEAGAGGCSIERQAILPLAFHGITPIVPARINGHPVIIGIDTGSSATVLTPEAAEHFHLPRDPHHTSITRGTGGATEASNVFLDSFGFGGASELMKTVAVVSIGGPKRDAGMAGLIGTDVLSDYDIEFRFPDHRLILYRVNHCQKIAPPWEGRYAAVPVTISDTRRFLVPVELNGHPVMAILDSGASGTQLSRSAAARIGVTEAMLSQDPERQRFGVGQMTYKSSIHGFEQMRIGNEIFHGAHISIADIPLGEADMLIGEDYIHTRRFWLSYATKTLFIQSQRNAAAKE